MEALSMIVLGILGAIMAVRPQKIVKPELLKDPNRVKIVRIAGAIAAVFAVFGLILCVAASY